MRENTGWTLKTTPDLAETPPPTEAELAALRRLDRDGFWHSGVVRTIRFVRITPPDSGP